MEGTRVSEETRYAALVHVLGLLTGFIGPLIVYWLRSEEDLVRDQAREVINFQLTTALAQVASALLVLLMLGVLTALAVLVAEVVLSIIGALAAARGERYRYPVCIRFVMPPDGSEA